MVSTQSSTLAFGDDTTGSARDTTGTRTDGVDFVGVGFIGEGDTGGAADQPGGTSQDVSLLTVLA